MGLSSSARAPGSNPDTPAPGGPLSKEAPCGNLVYWGRRVSAAAQGAPRHALEAHSPARGPQRSPRAPSLGQGLRAASSVLHARQAEAAHLLQVLSAGPATEGAAPFLNYAPNTACTRGPAQVWQHGLDPHLRQQVKQAWLPPRPRTRGSHSPIGTGHWEGPASGGESLSGHRSRGQAKQSDTQSRGQQPARSLNPGPRDPQPASPPARLQKGTAVSRAPPPREQVSN